MMAIRAQIEKAFLKKIAQEKLVYLERKSKLADSRKGEPFTAKHSENELSLLYSQYEPPREEPFGRRIVITNRYPPCTDPLCDLKPMLLNQLRLETHHRGHVLVVAIVGRSRDTHSSVFNAVVDIKEDAAHILVENKDPTLNGTQILPQGGLIAIKDPFYRLIADDEAAIVVVHPTDLVLLKTDDIWLMRFGGGPNSARYQTRSVSSLKESGNEAYKGKNYVDAVVQYSCALQACDCNDLLTKADLYRNRAIARLYLGRYEGALSDAESAIITDDGGQECSNLATLNRKAFYRAGCAAYHLRDFEKAKAYFSRVIDIDSRDTDALRELRRTNDRLTEQLQGRYDFDMMSESVTKKHRRLDHASYTAKVAIREAPGRGRHLFAMNAIEAGELVLCEKAFAVTFADEDGDQFDTVLDVEHKNFSVDKVATLNANLIHKVMHNPKQANDLLRLHDGGYEPKTAELVQDGLLAADMFRVMAIVRLNAFRCARMTSAEQWHDGCHDSVGIWTMASYANHSCVANVHRMFIGDMMVVYAIKDIKKDEEVTIAYKDPGEDPVAFQDSLQAKWNFRCDCILCQAESKVSSEMFRRRTDVVKRANEFLELPKVQNWTKGPSLPRLIRTAEDFYTGVECTYDEKLFRSLPRPSPTLRRLGIWLGNAYRHAYPEKCLKQALATLRNTGIFVFVEKDKVTIDRKNSRRGLHNISRALLAAELFEAKGQMKASRSLRDLGEQLFRIDYGSMSQFEEMVLQGSLHLG